MSSKLNMMKRGDMLAVEGYRPLPPREFWLEELDELQIESPVDVHGLVDVDRVIEFGKSLIDPAYEWPEIVSVHHLYWNKNWYGFPMAGEHAMQFRELPINKILIPRVFENLIHKVSLQPNIPSQEVMRNVIESWDIANRLFWSMRTVIRLERMADKKQRTEQAIDLATSPIIGSQALKSAMMRHFSNIELHMDRLGVVPSEFRLIEPSDEVLDCSLERRRYAKRLGSVVLPEAMPKTRELVAA